MHLLEIKWIGLARLGLLLSLIVACPWSAGGAELTILETTDLDFGAVVDRDGPVQLGLNDDVIFDPFGIHVGGVVTTGVYRIAGDPFASFSLSVSGSTVGGLGIGSFETSEGTPPLLNVALGISGTLDLRLGAQLTVNSSVASPGDDQPLFFTITVDYN